MKFISTEYQKDDCAPLLSVLCITYNHEKYISKALDSFLMQEVNFPIEIVIGEDCSIDNTLAVIEDYKNKFPNIIKLITSQGNVGVTENFRRTLNACKGRYIAICEGDDYWEDKKKLQIQVDFLESNPKYVITYHDAYIFNESGMQKNLQLPKEYQRDVTSDELISTRPISTLTTCFRNLLVEIPSEFNHAPTLDLCLWSLLGRHGEGKYMGGIKPAAYRLHEGGIFSSQNESNKILMTMRTYLCLAQFYGNHGDKKISQEFTLKTAAMAGSQLSILGKMKLILMLVDGVFGNRLYSIKRRLTGR